MSSPRLGATPPVGPSTPIGTPIGTPTDFERAQASEEFQRLRRSLRTFVFPATVLFLAWYLLYVLMSAYARGFMDNQVLGNINVAYVFGLLQFVSTFVIAWVYSRYANRHFDPTADAIRHRMEGTGAAVPPQTIDLTDGTRTEVTR